MSLKEKKLEQLHSELTDKLLEKLKDPEVKASDLNVASQFLKDNGIEGLAVQDSPLGDLVNVLPFPSKSELKKVSSEPMN